MGHRAESMAFEIGNDSRSEGSVLGRAHVSGQGVLGERRPSF